MAHRDVCREEIPGAVHHHQPSPSQEKDVLQYEAACARQIGKSVLRIAKRGYPRLGCRDKEGQSYEGREERQCGTEKSPPARDEAYKGEQSDRELDRAKTFGISIGVVGSLPFASSSVEFTLACYVCALYSVGCL